MTTDLISRYATLRFTNYRAEQRHQVWVANRAFLDTELYNKSVENGWLFSGINPEYFLGPALNLSIPAAYEYLEEKLSYFPSIGVKGYKIDRGEEGEMPGMLLSLIPILIRPFSLIYQHFLTRDLSLGTKYSGYSPQKVMLREYGRSMG